MDELPDESLVLFTLARCLGDIDANFTVIRLFLSDQGSLAACVHLATDWDSSMKQSGVSQRNQNYKEVCSKNSKLPSFFSCAKNILSPF